MKANSRRRVLISSMAMLLVALVALSTATFAWFTSNPNATASGLQLKATASKGLVIQTATHGVVDSNFWGHTDYLNCNDTGTASKTTSVELAPVSFDLKNDAGKAELGTAYTVEAEADNSWVAKSTGVVSVAGADSYYSENIACKLTGVTETTATSDIYLTSMAITTTSAVQKTAIRVALEYNGTLIGVYAPAATTNNYLEAPANYVDGTTTYANFTKTGNDFGTAVANTKLGTVGTTGNDVVTVTVYLDGEDANCDSSKIAASDIVSAITVNLKVQ